MRRYLTFGPVAEDEPDERTIDRVNAVDFVSMLMWCTSNSLPETDERNSMHSVQYVDGGQ